MDSIFGRHVHKLQNYLQCTGIQFLVYTSVNCTITKIQVMITDRNKGQKHKYSSQKNLSLRLKAMIFPMNFNVLNSFDLHYFCKLILWFSYIRSGTLLLTLLVYTIEQLMFRI